jgi:diguanylate cyclase
MSAGELVSETVTAPPPRSVLSHRFGQGVLMAALICFAASTVLRHGGYVAAFDGWLYGAIGIGATALCAARVPSLRARERVAWTFIAAGIAAFAGANVVSTLLYAKLDDPPYPSWADVGWLAMPPLFYAGIIVLVRARIPNTPRAMWLDGLVGGLGVAAIVASVAFDEITGNAAGSALAQAVNVAYPVMDLLLLVLVVCCVGLNGWRPDRTWTLLGAGLALIAVADTVYSWRTARDTYIEGTILDTLWPAGVMLIAAAPWRAHADTSRSAIDTNAAVLVPALFACSSVAVLVVGQFSSLPPLAVVFATGSVLAGLGRLVLTFHEVRTLATSRQEARTDELTTLGNRRFFYEECERLLAGRNNRWRLALLVIDLDRFKEVNDSLGHLLGDDLLRQIGPRLRTVVRDGDVLARLGGDEFAVLLEVSGRDGATDVAQRIRGLLTLNFDLDGVAVRVGASIGITMFPEDGGDLTTLLRRADVAMYEAKASGAGHGFYDPTRDHHSRERLSTIEELRAGISEGRLEVHYQPKFAAADGEIVGVEALVRWNHPTRGLLHPADFLGLAEDSGLVGELTSAVLERALADAAVWNRGERRVTVAVNLSVMNLLDPDFVSLVDAATQRHHLGGELLVLEITENLILVDPAKVAETLATLRSRGIQISLDDFGTGYSSLATLRRMPLDELKLDRSFVAAIGVDPTAATFVSTARELAHALGLRLVAEGVETAQIWETVKATGCDIGQGYFLSTPLPAPDVTAMLGTSNTLR